MADDTYSVQLLLTANNQISVTANGVTRDLNTMDRQLKQTAQSGGVLENSFRRMQQAMELGIAGALLQRVGNLASEMFQLGEQARIVGSTFEQLSGGAEQADSMLNRLRRTTGGIIDDLTLMQGANKYLSMGLGETQDEVARLIELATRLGASMGNNATESIENFALLMSNESILRLDTYGISAERVRTRIEELMDTGEALNRSDAFRMAVLEVGGQALERLGNAADAAITPIARLQTSLENFWGGVAERFAIGANATIGLIQGIADASVRSNPAVQEADRQAAARGEVIAQQFIDGYQTALSPEVIETVTRNALSALRDNPDLDLLDPMRMMTFQSGTLAGATDEQLQQYAFLLGYLQEQNALMDEAERVNERNLRLEQQRTEVALRARDAWIEEVAFASRFADEQERAARVRTPFDQADMAAQQLLGVVNPFGRGTMGGITLLTDAELARAEQLARQYEQALSAAEELHDQDLIADEQLDYLRRGAEEVERMRDAAREGAQAFREMTLSQALGGGTGTPLTSDLNAQFLSYAQSAGLSPAALQRLEDSLLLASGEYTSATLVMRDDIMPLLLQIREEKGDVAAAAAIANLTTFLQSANITGWTPEQIAAGLSRATGYGFTGTSGVSFTVNPGDTVSGIAAANGWTWEQVMAAAGITDPRRLQPGTYGMGGGSVAALNYSGYFSSPYATATAWENMPDAETVAAAIDPFKQVGDTLSKGREDAEAITAALNGLSAKEIVVKLDLQTNAPQWLMDLVEQGVRDNGGQVPGSTPRGRAQPYAG
jgi:hypothetical protein